MVRPGTRLGGFFMPGGWLRMVRFFNSLRFRLLLLVLLALLPVLGLVLRTASEQRRLAAIQAQEDALRLARTAAGSQEQLIGSAQQLLLMLGQLPAVRDPAACNAALAKLLKSDRRFTAIAVLEVDETRRCGAFPPSFSPDVAVRTPSLHYVYEQAAATRKPVVGGYGIGPYSGRGVLAFGSPILDENGLLEAVLTCTLDVAPLSRLAAQSLMPAGSTLTENDRDGTIVARFPDPEKWVGRSVPEAPIIQIVLNRRSEGTVEAVGEDGQTRLYAFTLVDSVPNNVLYVSVGIPTDVAYAQANQTLAANLIALGLVAMFALGAAWFASDLFVLRQVKDLLNVTGRLAGGNLSARTGLRHGVSELDQLARAFDCMVDALAQRETERRQVEEQVRRQAARAEALVNVAGRLSGQLDLGRVMEAICEESVQALHVQAATVSLYDEDRDLLHVAASHGLPSGYVESLAPWPRQAFEPWVSQAGAIEVSTGGGNAPDLVPEVCTVVRVPMVRERRLIGVVSIFALGQTRVVDEDDRMLLKGLAAQAALAIANARLFEALQQQERTRAELLHRAITAQEDERMRIARELHDETSQSLTALIVGLDTARMTLGPGAGRTGEYLQNARQITKRMLEDIRRLISDLRPTLLDDMGLLPAIAWYGEKRLKPAGIALHLDKTALPERLPSEMETVLFRVVQEALTNVVRHAGATIVDVRLANADGFLTMRVADNGQGFDLAPNWADSGGKGFGLRGMRERVRILGGDFALQTAAGQGTTITVRVPMPRKGITNV